VEKYNETVADNNKVAFIHISQDSSDSDAEDWATAESFPWLTVLPDDVKRSDLAEYHTRSVVPFYTMVDGDGKEVANGSSAIFQKIAKLVAE
tara:strand:- start:23 stop:298 length:276 start_codon:yes stop_codon:yes gene_type:complete